MSDLDNETEKVIKALPELTPEQARGIAARLILLKEAKERVTDFRPEQIPKLMKIVEVMQRSWFEEMRDRLFFPFYCDNNKGAIALKDLPKIDFSKGAKPLTEQLQDALGEGASISEWFFYPDNIAISELFYPSPIDGDDSITLFEASIMIGDRLLRSPSSLVIKSADFFAAEILNGTIDPRDPFTRVRWSDHPGATPDLRWTLYPDELQAYALSRWGRGVYTTEELGKRAKQNPALESATDTAHSPMKEDISEQSKATLYKIIGALAQALGESAHSNKVKLLDHGKAFAGSFEQSTGIVGYLDGNGLTSLKKTALEKHIGEALKRYERPRPKAINH